MLFLIDATDRPDVVARRAELRHEHLAYLEAEVHRLLAAGAKLTDDGEGALGSMYVLEAASREEAEGFIADDPYTRAGIFASVSVTRWRKGFFDYERVPPPAARSQATL